MAVMVRTLGYPARVAVGFTQGEQDPADGRWHVTTNEAHAWVEVLFPTYGWLAFEPTPNRTNPIANGYNDPAPVCVDDRGAAGPCAVDGGPGGANVDARPGQLENADFRRPAVKGGPGASELPGRAGPVIAPEPFRFPTGPVLGVLGALIALVLLLIPPVRTLRRRARLRRAGHRPRELILATYELFDARAGDLGWGRGDGETLSEYRTRVERAGVLQDGYLARLTALAGRAAYAERDPEAHDALDARAAAERTLEDLRSSTPLGRRVVGRYLPERLREG